MAYVEILRLTLRHAYFGSDLPPMDVYPADPHAFDRAGLLLRQRGAVFHVLADEDDPRPTDVELTVVGTSPDLVGLTQGAQWGQAAQLTAPLEVSELRLPESPAIPSATNPRTFGKEIAVLWVTLPESGRRDLTFAFDAVAALWAYHLTGPNDINGLEIIDAAGAVSFDDLGLQDLPNGQSARVIRSTQALEARARPDERFTLQKTGPFGPETLIPILPAATPPFRPIPTAEAPVHLQSDIFVTLW